MSGPQNPETLPALISRKCGAAGHQLRPDVLGAIAAHLALVLKWSRTTRLTAILDEEQAVDRHVIESLEAARFVVPRTGPLLDVGSGNGYPAIPIKCLYPGLGVTLLEPSMRRAAFLRHAATTLGLEGVQVFRERIERPGDLERYGTIGTITMRAVPAIEAVVHGAQEALPDGGRLIMLLGERSAKEVRSSLAGPITVLADDLLPGRRSARILVVERVASR